MPSALTSLRFTEYRSAIEKPDESRKEENSNMMEETTLSPSDNKEIIQEVHYEKPIARKPHNFHYSRTLSTSEA